jgi:ribosomal protein S18 acetylase RimI-like enzyme
VAEADGKVIGTTRLALRQEASAGGVGPLAKAIGWRHALRGALVLGLVAHARLAPDAAYVEELAVSPTHRRQGIGRALLDECDAIAARAGKSRITLWVAEGNAAAVALYRSCGYRVARRRRTLRGRLLFGAPVALLMEKPLPATTTNVWTDGTQP